MKKRIKQSKSRKVFLVFDYVFFVLISVIMLYPMWYVICMAFTDGGEIAKGVGMILWPKKFSLAAFKLMFKNPLIVRSFGNTIFIVVVSTVLNIILTSICAYVLSRKDVLWNKVFSRLIVFTMYFGGGMIPSYLINVKVLHLNDSWLALILPGAISVYNMIIMRTNFSALPDSLVESAQLDGASHWTILLRIVMPLSKAVIAVMVLYYAVGHWNAWFNASIYLLDRVKYPLQLVAREILIDNDISSMSEGVQIIDHPMASEMIRYAVIVATSAPILIVYPFLQRYFVGGVMIGAVKG